jgi:hypothetical protein
VTKRTTITEVRPTRPDDGEFFAAMTWLAIDSTGRRFGSTSEREARSMAEKYNGLRSTAARDSEARAA